MDLFSDVFGANMVWTSLVMCLVQIWYGLFRDVFGQIDCLVCVWGKYGMDLFRDVFGANMV